MILSLLSAAAAVSLVGWLLTLHGTRGITHVEKLFDLGLAAFLIIGLSSLIPLVAGRRRPRAVAGQRFGVAVITLAVLSLILSSSAFAFLSGFSPGTGTDETPRLIAAGKGVNGIPNVSVVVESPKRAVYELVFGSDGFQSRLTDSAPTTSHVFALDGLLPGSTYWYSLNGSDSHFFTTPNPSRPLHFAVASDAHFGTGSSRNDLTGGMLEQIADPDKGIDYFFSLGDNVEYGFRPEEWLLAGDAFSTVSSRIPSVFVPGNHDTIFTGLARFLTYAFPSGVSQWTSQLWRRVDVENVHFLILDVEWSAETISSGQMSWLEDQLQSIPIDDWTFVMSHGFYYASGNQLNGWKWYDNPETISRVTPLFEKYGVDLVFSGHAHQMELLQKSGVSYVIDGAFGGTPDPDRSYTSPESLWYRAGQYGYADVSVDGSKAVVTFRSASGSVLKSFQLARSGIAR